MRTNLTLITAGPSRYFRKSVRFFRGYCINNFMAIWLSQTYWQQNSLSYALNYKRRSYWLILRIEFWRNLIMNEYRGSISRSYKGFWYIANDSPQLTKLKRIGASHHVTGWLTSYLSNRLPFTDVDDVQFIYF